MSNGAGDTLLDGVITQAEIGLANPSVNQVCPDHDVLRVGIHALILCEKERRAEAKKIKEQHKKEEMLKATRNSSLAANFLSLSKKDGIRAAGIPAMIIAAVVAMLFFQWWQSAKLRESAKAIAEEAVTTAVADLRLPN